MYYEIHGIPSGGQPPLLLLHGAFSNIETDFGKILPALAESRQVIGVEQQGHGRTADIDRPLSYEQMAEDTAALLRHLGVEQADFFCYSFGGGVALQLALRHPGLARKLVLTGGVAYSPAGLYPEVLAGLGSMTHEVMVGTPWYEAYTRIAPRPEDFPTLFAKKTDLDRRWQGVSPEILRSLTAPVLLIIGDADIVRPEHIAEMFRLLGGGVVGDFAGLPRSWLAVLPGTTHVTLVDRAEWLISMATEFLAAPAPGAG
jgi:pimeloyl-ACP methyl ester carboxylesterase